MNALFERFVYAQLKREEAKQKTHQVSFNAHVSRRFWATDSSQKSIRPDIIARIGSGNDYEHIVMDTKWKIPGDGKPGDADLQQMHTYNVQFGAQRSFLIYPQVGNQGAIQGNFSQGEAFKQPFDHQCGMVFLDLFEGNKLRRDLGKKIVEMLTSPE